MIGVVISCEHAAWAVPPTCELGVATDILQSQASWDPGALDIATAVAAELNAPLFAGRYSRMFVDLNRAAHHPDVIPRHSYGADVPGNVQLSADAAALRLAQHHAPYWAEVNRAVDAQLAQHGACLHLSSHSFCPQLDPARRDFDVGVLFDPDHDFEARLAARLMVALAAAGLTVRANEPYSGTGPALVTGLREPRRQIRYAGIEIETSHALVASANGCARVANTLVQAVRDIFDSH
jgi:predicted N-formylglutamate amidohydrolase